MCKVLIVHHLEMCWNAGYNQAATCFEQLAERLVKHCCEAEYDRVILTRFEDYELGDEHIDARPQGDRHDEQRTQGPAQINQPFTRHRLSRYCRAARTMRRRAKVTPIRVKSG